MKFFMHQIFNESKLNFTKRDELLRKPNTGMINKANEKWNIEMKKSYIIGD